MTKILIVEDEPLVARMYQKMFDYDGYEVLSAIGGSEGLEKAVSENPDIILLDIMMPEPNGMEVLSILKSQEETKNIPVVMLTNLSGKHDAELAMSKGATDYWIKKEMVPKEMEKRVQKVLQNIPQIKKEEQPSQ